MANDPQVVTPTATVTGFSARVHSNPNDVIVDYLKDIRDQLATLNRKFDAVIELDYGANVRGVKVVEK